MPNKDDIWSDEEDVQTALQAAPAPFASSVFSLDVVRGPDLGQVFVVDGNAAQPTMIGTSEVADVRLRDREVSRRHIQVVVHDSFLVVTDHNSSNGTRVNGLRVKEAILTGVGEIIELGGTAIRVLRRADVAPTPLSNATSFGSYIGVSPAMRKLYPMLERLAKTNVPLVIEGETGTGKEALAEAIHAEGPRANRPFVIFDCTAVAPTLMDAALFGHEKGAFTGAVSAKPGVFEEADGGTLLIDEIGDLAKDLQAKLLRAIQKSEVRRLGGSKWIKVDVRILAATRRDLDAEVQAGRFRDDLFFRLAVARVVLPALRDRREDIAPLVRHFWSIYGGGQHMPEDVLPRFESHPWPGNVRELANTVARLAALGGGEELFMQRESGSVPSAAMAGGDFIDNVVDQSLEYQRARELVQREFERRYVSHLLEAHGGDMARAASASGIGDRYLRMIRARAR